MRGFFFFFVWRVTFLLVILHTLKECRSSRHNLTLESLLDVHPLLHSSLIVVVAVFHAISSLIGPKAPQFRVPSGESYGDQSVLT